MTVAADLLQGVPLFAGMTERSLQSVRESMREQRYEIGQDLVVEGEAGDSFLVIVEGAARVAQGGTSLAELGPGSFLGEISVIDGRPRTATVTATEPVQALVIERDDFLRLTDEHPALRLEVLMALTERIRRTGADAQD